MRPPAVSRPDGLFLADLDAVRDGDKAVLVLPQYDKDGDLVMKRTEYLKWAAGQAPVPADQCVVHRDTTRYLAVLKFKDLPRGVRHMSLADESPREKRCTVWRFPAGYPKCGRN